MAITVADIFPFSMSNNELGFTVERNISPLSADLAEGAESLSIADGDDAEDVFGTSKQLIIGQEIVLLSSGNSITRGQGGTVDVAHPAPANVRLRGGTSIVTFTFTGVAAETFTAIGMKGNAPAMFQVKINDSYGMPFFTGGLGQEQFFPFSGLQPAENDTIELLCWTNVRVAEFWAGTNK
jgi:hypothetical protein